MRILNRYLAQHIMASTAIVVLILMAVEGLLEFINQLSDIGTANYGIVDALVFVSKQLPADLYQLFPMAGFLGCLLGLGKLASTSQLVVIRAAGVSKKQIAWVVIKAAILMMILVALVGEFFAPRLQANSQKEKSALLAQVAGVKSMKNIWLRDGEWFVHFDQVISNTVVKNVSAFQITADHHLLTAAYSKQAIYKNGRWHMLNAQQSIFKSQRVLPRVIQDLPLSVVFNPTALEEGEKGLQQQSIAGLLKTIHYRKTAGLNVVPYQFSLWQRMMQPITAIVMICLGVPFIFGSLRQSSMGFRVLVGVMVGFAFYLLNQFFGPFAMLYHLPPILAAVTPTVIFAMGCLVLLRRSV